MISFKTPNQTLTFNPVTHPGSWLKEANLARQLLATYSCPTRHTGADHVSDVAFAKMYRKRSWWSSLVKHDLGGHGLCSSVTAPNKCVQLRLITMGCYLHLPQPGRWSL